MLRARTVLRELVVVIVLCGSAQTASAFCRLTTEKPIPGDNNCSAGGIGLAWTRPCLSFSVRERERPKPSLDAIRDVIDVSFSTWTDVECDGQQVGLLVSETAELAQCGTPEYNPEAPNANTIIFIEDWKARHLPEDAFGLTLVWHNGHTGEIYDADMQLNETIGPFAICDGECLEGTVDLQNVVTHEAGHFFGLGHSRVRGATMSASAAVGETSKRDLAQDDRNGLCSVYGQLPEPRCQSSDYAPKHGFSALCAPAMDSGGACSAARPGPGAGAAGGTAGGGRWLALLGLLAFAFTRVVVRQRAGRVATSNSTPSATINTPSSPLRPGSAPSSKL
jgi:hypothetical protein